MKITGSGPSAGTSRQRRVANGAGDGAAGSFAEQVGVRAPGPAGGTPGIAPTPPLAALSGVLAVQEVEDPTAKRRRAIRHGQGLLVELRARQRALVVGQVPEGILRRLARLVDGLRPSAADARLDAVLDAIELRAAVELAKLRREAE